MWQKLSVSTLRLPHACIKDASAHFHMNAAALVLSRTWSTKQKGEHFNKYSQAIVLFESMSYDIILVELTWNLRVDVCIDKTYLELEIRSLHW